MRRLVPGHLRLLRFRVRRLVRGSIPALLLLFTSVACGLVSGEKDANGQPNPGGSPLSMTPFPGLSKTRSREQSQPAVRPWNYVLPIDYGVRADASGKGHFRAPRFHGEHNGIDLLAPIGTPVFSACDGKVMAGASKSFGRWLHLVCPVPGAYSARTGPQPWASFFYAHLSHTEFDPFEWVEVKNGQELGAVGKSGNARSPDIQPHLHLELIVQRNQRTAMEEHHYGADQSEVSAASFFTGSLSRLCLDPLGFQPKSRRLSRARRLDPFVALTCLSPGKPDFRPAPEPLAAASSPWDEFYVARNFNVNRGPEDRTAAR